MASAWVDFAALAENVVLMKRKLRVTFVSNRVQSPPSGHTSFRSDEFSSFKEFGQVGQTAKK